MVKSHGFGRKVRKKLDTMGTPESENLEFANPNMKQSRFPKRPKVFYGYWMIAVTFLCLLMMSGAGNFVYSLFVIPLETDLGWNRGEIMIGFTIFFFMMGAASPVVGRIVDRHGDRKVIPAGALVMGIGFVLLSLMNERSLFYFGYFLVGTGAAAIGPVPTSAVVSNWFRRKRGTAIGLMSAGIGAGGVVLSPIVGHLIPEVGWRNSYLALAVIVWVSIIPLSLLVIKTKPAEKGLSPDNLTTAGTAAANESLVSDSSGLTLKMALGTSAFWLIAVAFLLSNFSNMGAVQAQVPHLDDIGFPTGTAAAALGAVGMGSAAGKFFFGWLCDQIAPKYAFAIGLCLQLVAIIMLMNVGPASSTAMVWLYTLTLGFGIGSWFPAMSIMVSSSFGLASYGAIFGVVNLAQALGTGSGPLMAGYLYDSMHTYHWAFVIFASLYAIAMPATLMVRHPRNHLHNREA